MSPANGWIAYWLLERALLSLLYVHLHWCQITSTQRILWKTLSPPTGIRGELLEPKGCIMTRDKKRRGAAGEQHRDGNLETAAEEEKFQPDAAAVCWSQIWCPLPLFLLCGWTVHCDARLKSLFLFDRQPRLFSVTNSIPPPPSTPVCSNSPV